MKTLVKTFFAMLFICVVSTQNGFRTGERRLHGYGPTW